MTERTAVSVEGVEGFFEKIVTKFGSGAKIDCPKQYLGRAVYVIIRRRGARVDEAGAHRRAPRRAEETDQGTLSR
ncbi:MAG: DUF2080 family transposase-associated protein [Acidimicrobiales bacterium]